MWKEDGREEEVKGGEGEGRGGGREIPSWHWLERIVWREWKTRPSNGTTTREGDTAEEQGGGDEAGKGEGELLLVRVLT